MEYSHSGIYRSSCLQVVFKIDVLKNFTIFTEKQLCQSLFLIKLQIYQIYQRETPTQVFSCEYCKILRTAFLIEHLWWLLLDLLQNFLKITVKKIISQYSISQKFLRNYFSLSYSVSKNNSFTGFSQFLSFFKHVRAISRTQSNIKMEPFAKIVNSSRGVFRTESNI